MTTNINRYAPKPPFTFAEAADCIEQGRAGHPEYRQAFGALFRIKSKLSGSLTRGIQGPIRFEADENYKEYGVSAVTGACAVGFGVLGCCDASSLNDARAVQSRLERVEFPCPYGTKCLGRAGHLRQDHVNIVHLNDDHHMKVDAIVAFLRGLPA